MRIKVFSSGSAGNCTILLFDKFNILVDCGITKKEIEENLNEYFLSIRDIDALLITHEHIDHIKSLPSFLKIEGLPIYMSKGTYNALIDYYMNHKKEAIAYTIQSLFNKGSLYIINKIEDSIFYEPFTIGNCKINTLPLFHDARETIGFSFNWDDKRFVYITDTGYVHQEIYPLISNANAYILESNHDPEILMHSSRPYPLKIRILSDHGHLSNVDSMVTLAHIMGPNTKLVMHAHISQECNLTQIVELTRKKVLDEYAINTEGIEFVILAPRPSLEYSV